MYEGGLIRLKLAFLVIHSTKAYGRDSKRDSACVRSSFLIARVWPSEQYNEQFSFAGLEMWSEDSLIETSCSSVIKTHSGCVTKNESQHTATRGTRWRLLLGPPPSLNKEQWWDCREPKPSEAGEEVDWEQSEGLTCPPLLFLSPRPLSIHGTSDQMCVPCRRGDLSLYAAARLYQPVSALL